MEQIGEITAGEWRICDIFDSYLIPNDLRLFDGVRYYEYTEDSHLFLYGVLRIVGRLRGGSSSASLAAHHIDDTINKDAPSAVDFDDSKSSEHQSGTTTFVENEGITRGITRSNVNLTSLGPPQFDANAIADFLAKPTILWAGSFTTAGAANDNLYTNTVATALQANTIWMNKIQGYNLFRGTAVLRLTANANPFQQGRLIMHFLPCRIASDSSHYFTMHNQNLLQKSNHPHVELGMRETSCELRIPYVTPFSYFDFSQQLYDWGTFWIDILSPLRVGAAASTTVDLTLFMSFEDVSLSAPFYSDIGNF